MEIKQKPKMKFEKSEAAPNGKGWWMCGGLHVDPWYIDWFCAETPKDAYNQWKKSINEGAA